MSTLSPSVPSEKKGVVEFYNGHFKISGEPHVLHRAERAILNARWEQDAIVVPVTDESAYEVMWFARRFPLQMVDGGHARIGSANFVRIQRETKAILRGQHSSGAVKFRKGKKPRHYQTVAADLWKSVGGLLLGDELGLGKTVSAACGLAKEGMRPALIVCTANLCVQWRDILRQFVPEIRCHAIKQGGYYDFPLQKRCPRCGQWSETNKRVSNPKCPSCGSRCDGKALPPDVLIVSYTMLHSWVSNLSRVIKTVVFDEVQELRNSSSNKWSAANVLGKTCAYRLGLSGTPIYNMGGELYNVYACIMPGLFGDKSTFRKTWCADGYYQGEPPLENPEALRSFLTDRGVFLRRTRADVGRELPPHTKIVHPIDADVSAIDKIQGRAKELARIILDGSDRKGAVMNASAEFDSLLRQATGLAKAPYVSSFVEMLLETTDKLMLFGWHRAVYEIWLQQLGRFNPVMYTGSEAPSAKRKSVERFVSGDSRILIVSLASTAGLDGIQFSTCRTGVFGELDWVDAKHRQGIGRYHRDGQSDPTFSYFLVSEFGSDPYVAEVAVRKRMQADALLGRKSDSATMEESVKRDHIKELARRLLNR